MSVFYFFVFLSFVMIAAGWFDLVKLFYDLEYLMYF